MTRQKRYDSKLFKNWKDTHLSFRPQGEICQRLLVLKEDYSGIVFIGTKMIWIEMFVAVWPALQLLVKTPQQRQTLRGNSGEGRDTTGFYFMLI
jgi:hypothetical protein